MELANHVAERADIDLVGLRVRLERKLAASAASSMRSARSPVSMSVASSSSQ